MSQHDSDEEKVIIAPEPPPSLVPPAESMPPPGLAARTPTSATFRAHVPGSSVPGSSVRGSSHPGSARSLPPLPEVDPILDQAAELRVKGDFDGALESYKKALFLVEVTDQAAQASLYANVAEVKLAQGKRREAETNFEKALGVNPKHVRSLDGLILLATDAKEWDRVIQWRKKRADAVEDDDERTVELCRVADVFEERLRDPRRAAETLEAAGLARPGDPGILLKLKQLYELQRAWPKLLDVLRELVKSSTRPRDRANFLFAMADVVLGRQRDEPRGVAYLELALDEDPQNDRALSALIAVRTRNEHWPELALVYERLIDRFAGLGDRERAWEVCKRLGVLRRDRLLDGPGALEAFRGAVDLRPEDAESRASLAELLANKGDRSAAVLELEEVSKHAPLRAQTYRRLYDLHARASRPDRAWLTATCLEELGASDVSHDLVIEQFRPDGAIRPTTALAADWWDELLRSPGADPIVCDILRTVSDVAIDLKLEVLAATRKLPMLELAQKHDRSSTASVVRTFVWASRALGVTAPDLYSFDDVPSGVAALPAAQPATALGPTVKSGLSVQHLAFLAGRHLTYYRPEHYALVFYPTLAELSSLVLAAVRIVIPGISVPPPADGEAPIEDALSSRLPPEAKKKLEEIVARLDARGGKLDLLAWIRHVELTAARAGLLLTGDLRVAMRHIKSETRAIGELSLETKRADLLTFTASERYATLRERMGVAIHPSSMPNLPTA
jgi:tetratricopeptide (TPR) repeat protein